LYVPSAATIDVSVLGAVDRAGQIELHAGDRLSMAVAKAGESTSAKSDLSHVFLTRELANGAKQTYDINLYQALQNNDPRFDVPMQKGDVVFVPETSQKGGFLWGGMILLRRLVLGY
jgi:protein involved in polysaccharide export with SLBB domain